MRFPAKAKLPFADGRGGESHHGEPCTGSVWVNVIIHDVKSAGQLSGGDR